MSENETTAPPPPSKEEIVHDIAKAIADRRKARNLTLEKVFQNIKIRIPYLQAIENGRWDQLPGDVFIRSFIKRYADHLGLDGDKLLAPYFELNKPPEKTTNYPQILKGGEISRLQLIGMALAGIVVIVLVRILSQEKTVVVSPTQTPVSVTTATAATPIAIPGPSAVSELHQLEVYSPNELWLRVNAKEKNFEGVIPQGATWTWKADGAFSIRLGHTKEVSMHFDGKPVALQDNQKRVDLP